MRALVGGDVEWRVDIDMAKDGSVVGSMSPLCFPGVLGSLDFSCPVRVTGDEATEEVS